MIAPFRLKFERATHHLKQLKIRSDAWLNSERYAFVIEPNPDGSGETFIRVARTSSVPANPFSLIVGDILYNLRSCLDNLAFELNGGVTKGIGNKSQFPIFWKKEGPKTPPTGEVFSDKRARLMVSGMCKSAQTIIESLQPYKRGKNFNEDPLWLLNELCNMDKHRTIHVVASVHGGVGLFGIPGKKINVKIRNFKVHKGRLEVGAIVAQYTATPTAPDREMNMNLHSIASIGFADGPAKDRPVGELLHELADYVANDAIKPLEKFVV